MTNQLKAQRANHLYQKKITFLLFKKVLESMTKENRQKPNCLTLGCTAIYLCSEADTGVPCQRINPYKSSINGFRKDNVAYCYGIKVATQNLKVKRLVY